MCMFLLCSSAEFAPDNQRRPANRHLGGRCRDLRRGRADEPEMRRRRRSTFARGHLVDKRQAGRRNLRDKGQRHGRGQHLEGHEGREEVGRGQVGVQSGQ